MTRAKIIDIIKSSLGGYIRLDNKAEYKETYTIDDISDNGLATKSMVINSLPIVPIIEILGATTDVIQAIQEGNIVEKIYIIKNSGTLSIKIGLTPGGDEIYPDTNVDPFNNIQVQQYFAADGNLYFDLTGSGNINIYIYYSKLL